MTARCALATALVLAGVALSGRADADAESAIVNVTPAFRPGPYTTLSVHPADPRLVAVGMPDGYLSWSDDGGLSTNEVQVLSPRTYVIASLRTNNARKREYASPRPERGGIRLFISLLHQGKPLTRWATWLSLSDPVTEMTDIAWSGDGRELAIASPAGAWVGDVSTAVFSRVLGGPRPKSPDLGALSIVIDPANSKHILVGTKEGMKVSRDGGRTFTRHPDEENAEEEILHFQWSAETPQVVFAMTSDNVLKSEDGGETFKSALEVTGDLNGLSIGPDAVYVATSKGLTVMPDSGEPFTRFNDEPIIGVMAAGKSEALVATEDELILLDLAADTKTTLLRAHPGDPFLALSGHSGLAWALTKYAIFRVGAFQERAEPDLYAPRLTLTLPQLERAILHRLGVLRPEDTRFQDRWYAKLLPQVSFRIRGSLSRVHERALDGTLPVRFATVRGTEDSLLLGDPIGQPAAALIMLHWDLAKIAFGPYGNVSMPSGLLEAGLRSAREGIVSQIRWRYRECANVANLLRHPPKDEQSALYLRMRFEEYVSYLRYMSGREIAAFGPQTERP